MFSDFRTLMFNASLVIVCLSASFGLSYNGISGNVAAAQPEPSTTAPVTSTPDAHAVPATSATADHAEPAKHSHTDIADAGHDAGHTAHSHIGEKGVSEDVLPGPNGIRYDMVIYNIVIFLVLLSILTKYAWGPIMKSLDDREAMITKNIQDAEQARMKAETLLAEHRKKLDAVQDEVREIIAEARRDAEHTKTQIVATANKEASLMQTRAVEEISRAKDQALNELFGNMTNQIAKATEQVIARSLTDDDRNRFVNEAVNGFVSSN